MRDLREKRWGERRRRERRTEQSRLAAWRRLEPVAHTTSVPEEKAERITPCPLINQKAPAPEEDTCHPISHHSHPLSCPSTPSCTPILLLPGGGERHCTSPPARYSCTVRGSMLRVTIYEREEGRLSGDFHMNKDQPDTISSFLHLPLWPCECANVCVCMLAHRLKSQRE